jgi:putative ABC transport system permease protein
MIRSYLQTAWRNIIRHKGFSFINIFGLAVGLACFLLIAFYVRFERSYDDFHLNRKDIYVLVRQNRGQSYSEERINTGAPMAPLLTRSFPEVEEAVRLTVFRGEIVGRGPNKFVEKRFFFADPGVFRVFTFPLERGDPETALAEPLTVVLTRPTAEKYFGSENPLGRVVTYNFYGRVFDFRVTGVLASIPRNTQLEFDFLASYASLKPLMGEGADYFLTKHWDSPTTTFVKLRAGTDPGRLNAQFPALVDKHVDKLSYTSVAFRLQPLKDLYFNGPGPALGPRGNSQFVLVLSAVALFILLIACVNFMNLATARSEYRAREIGIRKIVGAEKRQLVAQFLGESLVFSFLALTLAAGLVELLRPAFSSFVGKDIVIDYGRDLGFLGIMLLTATAVGLLAGAYPAFFLAAYRPVHILKSRTSARRSGLTVRKVLVVGQFVLSIALIVAALFIGRQVAFLKNMDVGFKKEEVIVIPVRDRNVLARFDSLKSEWLHSPGVEGVTASSQEPGVTSQNGINLRGRGNPDTEMGIVYVDPDYFRVMGVPLDAGRDFTRGSAADAAGALMLNESAARRLGWTDPVGEPAELFFKEEGRVRPVSQTSVIGVVKDFNFRDLTTPLQPVLFKINPRACYYLLLRLAGPGYRETVAALRRTWEGFSFNQPFEFSFLEDDMNAVYAGQTNFARIAAIATGLAVVIACLGLFGLASYAIARRVKEIGIRKVMGASLPGLVLLLSRDFLALVLLANLLAWPLAYFFVKDWLQGFAFRISIGLETFILAGCLALGVALVTVGFQALRAGRRNPVDSIRYE